MKTPAYSTRRDTPRSNATEPIGGTPGDWFLWAALGSVLKFLGSEVNVTPGLFSPDGKPPTCSSASTKSGEGDLEAK
jgi:hypothetical protein